MTWGRSLLIIGVMAVAGPTYAQVAAPTAPTAQSQGKTPTIERSRRSIVQGAETIDDLAEDAKKDQDMPRVNCVEEVQVDAGKVTTLATAEYLRARDPNADAMQRIFAQEKLGAAAQTMGALVDDAKGCTFASSDEDPTLTANDSKEESLIPTNDPTAIPVTSPDAPPVLDPNWLPTASGQL
jgi:hypothetical protein